MARDNVGVNCAAESEVEYAIPPAAQQEDRTIMTPFGLLWETAGEEPGFFCFGDPSPNAYPVAAPWPSPAGCPSPMVEALEPGSAAAPFCQDGLDGAAGTTRHQFALHLQAGNHVYWGGQWGTWNMRAGNVVASFPGLDPTTGQPAELPADGIAFWAKKDPYSDAQLVVQLEDENVSIDAVDENGKPTCIKTVQDPEKDPVEVQVTVTSSDPSTQTSSNSPSSVQAPLACGNRWRTVLELGDDWELHLLPFSDFYQDLQPNREATPLNPKKLYQVSFAYSPGQTLSVWLDEMSLFRYKN